MSLEQAINDLNASIKQLITVMATEADAPAVEGTEPAPKRTRRTKAEMEAAKADSTPAASTTAQAPAVAPSPAPAPSAAAAGTTAEPGNVPAGTSATTGPTASIASSNTPAMSDVIEKMKALHQRDGNAGVKKILDKFGVDLVPKLATKNLAEVMAAVEAELNPAPSLFG